MPDFDGYAANAADPEATGFLGGPTDRRSAWRLFSSGAGSWVVQGAGWWALELLETGEMVGTVGAFFRDGCPDLEVGWTLYPRHWGHGYAIEAAKAALAHGIEKHRPGRVVALIAPANTASIAVSTKLGMKYETDVDFFDEPCGRYLL